MKYQVQIKYTNPAHEHVSLRRRVDTVNRIVEAKSEDEALNRAANQQRALGFKIQEAKIVEQPKAPAKIESLSEAKENITDADKRVSGYKKSPAVAAAQAKSDVLSRVVKRPQAGTLAAQKMKEEVEFIEEKLTVDDPASKWISDFVHSDNPKFAGRSKKERIKQALAAYYSAKNEEVETVEEGFDTDPADIAAYLVNRHGKGNVTMRHIEAYERGRDSYRPIEKHEVMKHVKKMSEEVEQVDEASHVAYLKPKANAPSDVKDHFDLPVHSDSKKDAHSKFAKVFGSNMAKHYEVVHVKQKAVKEDVETVDEAQKKLKPSYWRAEWRLGTQTEVDKNNKKIYDRLVKTDPEKAAKFHDNLVKMRKEEIETIKEVNTRVVNKEVKKEKAAETAVAAARRAKNTKNKVEIEPKLNMDVVSSEKKYVTKV
jgi:hypothetical protein